MANSSTPDELVRVVRSPSDKRDYQHLVLENQLKVLLVHCPDSSKAAASMAVNAGHFDDPPHTQGLAHFLEHMFFMGSQSYPEPSSFNDFLSAHGGQHNAWTGTEFTNFHFDCNANALETALERFASILKEPLFSNEWVQKEKQSIESEFRLKQKDELRRLYQVHKVTANQDHPFSQFSVGNLNTLKDDKHGTLQQKLIQFYQDHYSANQMQLVVAGPQSLTKLADIIQTLFADIQNHKKPKLSIKAPLYTAEQKGLFLQVRPLKKAYRLILTFPLPGIDQDYRNKTTSFIAHIVGYEGPGSLFNCLRDKGWINSLSAGGGISGSNFKDFNVNIQLTESGRKNITTILQWVFAYLGKINTDGIEDWRYQERKVTSELSFLYQEPTPVGELVSQLSINAFHYSKADIIYGDYRMDGLDHDYAAKLLALMTPAHSRITLISPDVETNQKAPIYDTEYSVTKLTESQLDLFTRFPCDFNAMLPKRNRFINDRLHPQPLESENALPTCLSSSDLMELWHLQDNEFRVPKGHIYLALKLPAVTSSAYYFAIARLWSELIIDALNDDLYDAEVAGLHFNIYPTQQGIVIHTTGLSEGQLPLMSHLMKRALLLKFAHRRFRDIKHTLVANWQSAHQNQPLNKLFAELNQQLQPGLFRLPELANQLLSLSFREFTQALEKMFEPVYVQAFMHGDWQSQQADRLATLIRENLPTQQPAAKDRETVKRVGDFLSKTLEVPCSHSDNAVLFYQQGNNDSEQEQVCYMLLQQLVHQPFFHDIRTKKQLGYAAGSQYFPIQRLPGILFFIQSNTASTDRLTTEILNSLEQLFVQLDSTTLKAWHHSKSVLEQQIRTRDRSLRVKSQRLWGAIQLGDTSFNRQLRLLDALGKYQLADWLSDIKQKLSQNSGWLRLQTTSQGK
ncbi:peptidase M16 [Idiomarina sp. 29L]|uniref:insulinase family protein n=1 Tax=Idiomarina sp. 29L TaxID=2508877 RepID=UPI001013AA7E|nr:insulinase family protein [Idiomarina sp. 29L]RXS44078.1 peptidase M16 [Idiomarina sp. 29L]